MKTKIWLIDAFIVISTAISYCQFIKKNSKPNLKTAIWLPSSLTVEPECSLSTIRHDLNQFPPSFLIICFPKNHFVPSFDLVSLQVSAFWEVPLLKSDLHIMSLLSNLMSSPLQPLWFQYLNNTRWPIIHRVETNLPQFLLVTFAHHRNYFSLLVSHHNWKCMSQTNTRICYRSLPHTRRLEVMQRIKKQQI